MSKTPEYYPSLLSILVTIWPLIFFAIKQDHTECIVLIIVISIYLIIQLIIINIFVSNKYSLNRLPFLKEISMEDLNNNIIYEKYRIIYSETLFIILLSIPMTFFLLTIVEGMEFIDIVDLSINISSDLVILVLFIKEKRNEMFYEPNIKIYLLISLIIQNLCKGLVNFAFMQLFFYQLVITGIVLIGKWLKNKIIEPIPEPIEENVTKKVFNLWAEEIDHYTKNKDQRFLILNVLILLIITIGGRFLFNNHTIIEYFAFDFSIIIGISFILTTIAWILVKKYRSNTRVPSTLQEHYEKEFGDRESEIKYQTEMEAQYQDLVNSIKKIPLSFKLFQDEGMYYSYTIGLPENYKETLNIIRKVKDSYVPMLCQMLGELIPNINSPNEKELKSSMVKIKPITFIQFRWNA
jgi:hypothetical protein